MSDQLLVKEEFKQEEVSFSFETEAENYDTIETDSDVKTTEDVTAFNIPFLSVDKAEIVSDPSTEQPKEERDPLAPDGVETDVKPKEERDPLAPDGVETDVKQEEERDPLAPDVDDVKVESSGTAVGNNTGSVLGITVVTNGSTYNTKNMRRFGRKFMVNKNTSTKNVTASGAPTFTSDLVDVPKGVHVNLENPSCDPLVLTNCMETQTTSKSMNTRTPTKCPFCSKAMPSKNFSRHLQAVHTDEDKVKQLKLLSKSKCTKGEIMKITNELRKIGSSHLQAVHTDEDEVKQLKLLSKSKSTKREIIKLSNELRKIGRYEHMIKPRSVLMKTHTPTICPFCSKAMPSKNFSRHLQAVHTDEDKVKQLNLLSKSKSKKGEIMKVTNELRKFGRYEHMIQHGTVLRMRTTQNAEKDIMVVCQFCLGGYNIKCFRSHWPKCPQKPASDVPAPLGNKTQKIINLEKTRQESENEKSKESVADVIQPVKKKKVHLSKYYSKIIPSRTTLSNKILLKTHNLICERVRLTEKTKVALEDDLIINVVAKRLPTSEEDLSKIFYFTSAVRDLTRVLHEIKKLDPSINKMADCFRSSNFPTLVKAVKQISGTKYVEGTIHKSSFSRRLKPLLECCCDLLLSTARTQPQGEQRNAEMKELLLFKDELVHQWRNVFGNLVQPHQSYSHS